MLNHEGKCVLVTGGTTGIGYATAELFLKAGAHVVIAGRNLEAGEKAISGLRRINQPIEFFPADVSQPTVVKHLIEQVVKRFGKLDMAFNNAGIEGAFAPITEIDDDSMDQVIDINLKGVWLCCKYQIAQFKKQLSPGAIVNTSSWLAKGARSGTSVYSASKAALDGMTRALAIEAAADNIRINNVNPGYINTPMLERFFDPDSDEAAPFKAHAPMQRFGKPEEVAKAVIWLCSEEASFITGETLLVDGGLSIAGQR